MGLFDSVTYNPPVDYTDIKTAPVSPRQMFDPSRLGYYTKTRIVDQMPASFGPPAPGMYASPNIDPKYKMQPNTAYFTQSGINPFSQTAHEYGHAAYLGMTPQELQQWHSFKGLATNGQPTPFSDTELFAQLVYTYRHHPDLMVPRLKTFVQQVLGPKGTK